MRTKIVNTLNRIVSDSVFGAWAISITAEEAQWILDNLKPEPQEEPPVERNHKWTDSSTIVPNQDYAMQRKRDIAQMAAVIYAEYSKNNDPSNAPVIMDLAICDAAELYGRVMI